ncbi:MAG TPA: hypothetical protein VHO29_14475 [Marmoricola sp.]|nr:hypothetical protein [Marmoricola sp.]
MVGLQALLTRPRRVELVLAAAVALLGVGEVWVPFSSRQGSGSATSATIGVLLVATCLLWCRREPLLAVLAFPLVWGTVALVAPTYVLFYGTFVPLEIGVFMSARFGRGRAPLYAALVAAASLLGVDLFVSLMQDPGEIAFHWTVTALVWASGFGLRTLDRRARASMRRAIDAEVGAAEQAMRAVLEERALPRRPPRTPSTCGVPWQASGRRATRRSRTCAGWSRCCGSTTRRHCRRSHASSRCLPSSSAPRRRALRRP